MNRDVNVILVSKYDFDRIVSHQAVRVFVHESKILDLRKETLKDSHLAVFVMESSQSKRIRVVREIFNVTYFDESVLISFHINRIMMNRKELRETNRIIREHQS